MKRIFINDMPWKDIQLHYDEGMSLRELQEKFRISFNSFNKAKHLKLFSPRDLSSAMKINILKNPRDYSEVRNKRTDFANYRADCSFKFVLSDFPDEFNFQLIKIYGWYKPKNKGDNLNGVSRDHAVSVRYGFDHGLPVTHLAHPANCVLMRHSDNVTKYIKNSMSYEGLIKRINSWDKKYGGLG